MRMHDNVGGIDMTLAICGTLEAQITTLLACRKSLIHECVTGRRRITEADVARVQKKAPNEWRMK